MNKSFQECGVDEDYFWSILDQIGMRAMRISALRQIRVSRRSRI